MLIDLQLHSTYSDGYLTPTQLASFMMKQGVKIASLTDHNSVSGSEEFKTACKKYKIKTIPGLELYIKFNNKKLNLLWYNFDECNADLHALLRDSQIRRRGKVREVLEKLVKNNFKINVDKVLDKYTHYVPVNHIVDDIMSVPFNRKKIERELKNKNPREGEIISEYFRKEKYGKLRESYISLERVLKLKKKVGGQLILNHPGKNNRLKRDLLTKLKKKGICGIELLSPHHSLGSVMYAQFIARELDFITTGGSDFHRHEEGGYLLQDSWNYFKVDSKYLRGIKKIIS